MKNTWLILSLIVLLFGVMGCENTPIDGAGTGDDKNSLLGEWCWVNTIRDTSVETVAFTADSMSYIIYYLRAEDSSLHGDIGLHDEYFITNDTIKTWNPLIGLSGERAEYRKMTYGFKVDNDTLYIIAHRTCFVGDCLMLPEKLIRGGKSQWMKELQ